MHLVSSGSVEDFVSQPTTGSKELHFAFQVVVDKAVLKELEDLGLLLSEVNLRTFVVLLRLLLMVENRSGKFHGLIVKWVRN